MEKSWAKEAELSLRVVSTAAEILEEQYQNSLNFKTKSTSRDIVTELDIAIENYIKKEIKFLGYPIIGEESIADEKIPTDLKNPIWFIDPIDGTTNFISSIPFYSISLGMAANGTFVVGAVIFPALKEIFFTSDTRLSFLNGKELSTSSADLKNSLLAVAFSSKIGNNEKRKKEYQIFGELNDASRGCLRTGSASLNVCYVACGRLQCAYGIANKIWDVAGPLAIAIQAGCKVYMEFDFAANEINYVVGFNGVADEVAIFLKKNRLIMIE